MKTEGDTPARELEGARRQGNCLRGGSEETEFLSAGSLGAKKQDNHNSKSGAQVSWQAEDISANKEGSQLTPSTIPNTAVLAEVPAPAGPSHSRRIRRSLLDPRSRERRATLLPLSSGLEKLGRAGAAGQKAAPLSLTTRRARGHAERCLPFG